MDQFEEFGIKLANDRKEIFALQNSIAKTPIEDLNFLIEIQKKIEEIVKHNLYEEDEIDHQKWFFNKNYQCNIFPYEKIGIIEEIKISDRAKKALLATKNFSTILFTFFDLEPVRIIINKYHKRHITDVNFIYFDTDMFLTLAKYSRDEQIKLKEKIISELVTLNDFAKYYHDNTHVYLNKIFEIINTDNALFEELGIKWKKDLWNICENVLKDFYDSYSFLCNYS